MPIAWRLHGVVGLQPPEVGKAQMRGRLLRRFEGATEAPPSAEVQSAIAGITALLAGKSSDLSMIELDIGEVTEFHRRVYAIARTIPSGSTLSYGGIAFRLGEPGWPAAREVGQDLGQNTFPIVVPCHRVVAAGGKLGGFSARGELTTKRRILQATDA